MSSGCHSVKTPSPNRKNRWRKVKTLGGRNCATNKKDGKCRELILRDTIVYVWLEVWVGMNLRFIQNFCQKEKICGTWKKSSLISGRHEEEKEDEEEEEEEEEGVNLRYFKKDERRKRSNPWFIRGNPILAKQQRNIPRIWFGSETLSHEPLSWAFFYSCLRCVSQLVGRRNPVHHCAKKPYQIFGMDF